MGRLRTQTHNRLLPEKAGSKGVLSWACSVRQSRTMPIKSTSPGFPAATLALCSLARSFFRCHDKIRVRWKRTHTCQHVSQWSCRDNSIEHVRVGFLFDEPLVPIPSFQYGDAFYPWEEQRKTVGRASKYKSTGVMVREKT